MRDWKYESERNAFELEVTAVQIYEQNIDERIAVGWQRSSNFEQRFNFRGYKGCIYCFLFRGELYTYNTINLKLCPFAFLKKFAHCWLLFKIFA